MELMRIEVETSAKRYLWDMLEPSILSNAQTSLQRWSCVSRSWSNICHDLVRYYFNDYHQEKAFSNWVLAHFTNSTRLQLCGSEIQKIKDETFLKFTNLRELEIIGYRCSASLTDYSFSKLSNLTTLSLNYRFFSDTGISHLTRLSELVLGEYASITNNGVKHLVNLTKLDLISNSVISDDAFQSLSNLTELSLGPISRISNNAAKFLRNLRILNLSYCNLIGKEFLKELTNLTTLKMDFNSINQSVDDEVISKLTSLTSLEIGDGCNSIKNSLSKLTNLTHLYVRGDYILTDTVLSHLTNLVDFSVSGDLGHISEVSLSCLTRLNNLKLFSFRSRCQTISDNSISRLIRLENLQLFGTDLITAETILSLTNLKSLRVSKKNIDHYKRILSRTNINVNEFKF